MKLNLVTDAALVPYRDSTDHLTSINTQTVQNKSIRSHCCSNSLLLPDALVSGDIFNSEV